MRRPESTKVVASSRSSLIFVLLLIVAACNDVGERKPLAEDSNTEEDFSEFARAVFAQMQLEPFDAAHVEIGLFGDLSVHAGERLVMGRYRYRVDSTERGAVGSMAFHLRDTSRAAVPVPVVVTFARAEDSWRFERASFGDAASATPLHDSDDTGHHESDDPMDAQTSPPLHQSLRTRLDAWVEAAIQRSGAGPVQ